MVNWQSVDEQTKDYAAFIKLIHALCGVYIWEFALSFGFDWEFITLKKRFRWPLIFYFAGRYLLLFALIGILISLNVTSEVNCQALYMYNQVLGNLTLGLASFNLALRTMAIWNQKWFIIAPLVLLAMGHWALLLNGVLLQASWVGGACVITKTSNKLIAASFIYGMCYDFIVICLTGWKLGLPSRGRSRLVTLIFGDGLIYFVVVFLMNMLATIFMLLNLNPIMSIIANVPAALVSTIAACRAVRRLHTYANSGAELYTSTQGSSFKPASRSTRPPVAVTKAESVHVQMDNLDNAAHNGYGGNLNRSYDPEAQTDDFKSAAF